MNKTFGIYLALIMILVVSFGTWRHFSISETELELAQEQSSSTLIEMDEEKALRHGIQTQKTGPGKLSFNLSSRGKITLHPDLVAHILPKVAGVSNAALKNWGDSVEVGEVLAVLESREMAETKANYLAALEKEKLHSSLYVREERLFNKKVSSEQELLSAKSAYEDAKIQLQLAKQKLFAFGLSMDEVANMTSQNAEDLRLFEIRSPIKGVVIERDITNGEYVEETTPIYAIADLSKVWVEIGIYPKDFQKVKVGQMVEVSKEGSTSHAFGKITYLSPIVNEETITAKAVAELENFTGEWKPGTYVFAKIKLESQSVPLLISKNAVQVIDGESIVFVQTPEGFEKRFVKLGRSDEGNVEIVSGLDLNEHYAKTNAFLLKADLGKDSVEHED